MYLCACLKKPQRDRLQPIDKSTFASLAFAIKSYLSPSSVKKQAFKKEEKHDDIVCKESDVSHKEMNMMYWKLEEGNENRGQKIDLNGLALDLTSNYLNDKRERRKDLAEESKGDTESVKEISKEDESILKLDAMEERYKKDTECVDNDITNSERFVLSLCQEQTKLY
eukprot:TRINITY_DN4912_c0_g2_i4.p1 TRINITY_DN4912_c0_g2~~TRINITY_DN4912_c0_g2_i4.p1  ORF type:complete len:168 (-),score=44.84 TRINITY_DN4912_c0_g2_i4:197-700(-)